MRGATLAAAMFSRGARLERVAAGRQAVAGADEHPVGRVVVVAVVVSVVDLPAMGSEI